MPQPDEPAEDDMGELIDFPRSGADPVTSAEVEKAGPVIDAEFVDEDELPQRVEHGRIPPALAGTAKEASSQAWRLARRHGTIVLKGVEQQRQQRKADREQADLKAARRLAVERGDYTEAREISRQMIQERTIGVEALRARLELVWSLTKKAAVAITVLVGIAVVTGTINAFGDWLGPWDALDVLYLLGSIVAGVFYTARFVVTNWLALVPSLLGVVAAVWLTRRWRDGRRLGENVLPVELRTGDVVIYVDFDESALVTALANIGVAELKAAVKEGWPHRATDRAWVQFPIVDGNGMAASLRLPLGVPVEKVRKAKVTLAHNLGCLAAELWAQRNPADATVMDIFRLNPGELRKPAPEYPLLHEGTTDYFTGFPVGISPRGEEITGFTFERNYVISGIMGSGKTTLVVSLLAGAVLDPLVDIDVFVFAENADYDGLKSCFNTFVMGDTAGNVQACREHIQGMHADLGRRGKLLQQHGVNSVNRQLAAKEPQLRPRIVVIDECQSYFRQGDPQTRREVIDEIVRFYSAARKYAVTLVFVTPLPSDKSLPRDLVAVTSNRACFAIGDKTRNNVVLGEKAHENGISALGLQPRTKTDLNDVGTSITIGFTPVDGTTLRSYHLSRVQQEKVAERAKQERVRAGRAPGGQSRPELVERDLLEDLDAVLGVEPVSRGDVPALLRGLAPEWRPYQELTGRALTDQLAELGVKVPSTNNRYPVDPASVRAALARRATADLDEEAE